MMLILWFLHTVYVAADWIVMPLCLSSSIESIVAPTPSFPFTWKPYNKDCQNTNKGEDNNSEENILHLITSL